MKKYISYIIYIIYNKLYIIDIFSMKGVQIWNKKIWEKKFKNKIFNLLHFLMKFLCFWVFMIVLFLRWKWNKNEDELNEYKIKRKNDKSYLLDLINIDCVYFFRLNL